MTALFEPIPASGVKLSASTSSGSVKLGGNPQGPVQVSVYNSGSVGVLVDFGDSTITVTNTTGHGVPPGTCRGFTIQHPAKMGASGTGGVYMAGITLSSTADVYVSLGHGI